jgi:hypothetical protein
MKKILLALIALSTTTWVTAQEDALKMWLGGTVNYCSSTDDDDNDVTDFTFGPSFGYSINENLAVGLGIGYSASEENDLKGNFWEVNPFFRYYWKCAEMFAGYGALNLSYGAGSQEVQVGLDEVKDDEYNQFNVEISPGIQFWFKNHWSINSELGFFSYTSTNDVSDDVNDEDFKSSKMKFGIDFNRIKFGLNYHF